MSKPTLFALSGDTLIEIPVDRLTPVGGAQSTGVAIPGLKHSGDYAILANLEHGISIHPLRGIARGKKARTHTLSPGKVLRIEDLTLFAREAGAGASREVSEDLLAPFREVLRTLVTQSANRKPLQDVLSGIAEIAGHDHGLVVSQDLNGEYEVLVAQNLNPDENWLSEHLVQTALRKREPVIIQNVLGSGFDTQKSLMATKFLSIFCWPLVAQGKVIGALLTSSKRPYARSYPEVRERLDAAIDLAAVVLDFHLRELRLKNELSQYRTDPGEGPFLTNHPKLAEVGELARKVAPSDLSVLIQGETGVGKEVLCRWLHQQSRRKAGPLVAVNCAAIPADLLESTLFGHKRGAFTGAHSDHAGKILQAHGGTLFLDEIGDLSLPLQAKILRVLQERTIEPVGSNRPVPVDVRIICATHRDLPAMGARKEFREDLYYRVAQITLTLPPLRERISDIRLLTQLFVKEFDGRKRLSQEAWSWVLGQPWPGNIRELRSAVQRAVLLASGEEIQVKDFRAGAAAESSAWLVGEMAWLGAPDLESAKGAFVRGKIEQALELTAGNRTRAAELLGVTPRTLFRYLEQRL